MNKERAAQIAERDAIKYEQMVKLLRVCAVVSALCSGQVLRAGPLRRPWEISTELSGPGNPHVHCSWTCYDKLTRYNCLYPSMWLQCSAQLYVWVLTAWWVCAEAFLLEKPPLLQAPVSIPHSNSCFLKEPFFLVFCFHPCLILEGKVAPRRASSREYSSGPVMWCENKVCWVSKQNEGAWRHPDN